MKQDRLCRAARTAARGRRVEPILEDIQVEGAKVFGAECLQARHRRMEIIAVIQGDHFGLHLRRCEFSERAGKGERDGGPGLLPGQGKLVVLVDDDAAILAAMRSLFAQWGIDLIAEPSLEAAKAALAASGRAPNLILSDYRLPGEHDGIAVVAQCRALFGEDLPGVLITGDTGKEAIQAIDQSELRVMHKPLQPAKLRALLTHLLGSA